MGLLAGGRRCHLGWNVSCETPRLWAKPPPPPLVLAPPRAWSPSSGSTQIQRVGALGEFIKVERVPGFNKLHYLSQTQILNAIPKEFHMTQDDKWSGKVSAKPSLMEADFVSYGNSASDRLYGIEQIKFVTAGFGFHSCEVEMTLPLVPATVGTMNPTILNLGRINKII